MLRSGLLSYRRGGSCGTARRRPPRQEFTVARRRSAGGHVTFRFRPSSAYGYTVTADNDTSARPFAAAFSTAPRGRQPFRFTSSGDLATPNTQWVLSYGQSAYAVAAGPAPLTPVASIGNPAIAPGTSFYIRGYSGGAQTAWLEHTLAAARRDPSIDWIVVQMHQIACSSSATGNGSDLGIRQAWLPLFDKYQVDLVLNGHDHDYERSFPCRGFDSMAGTEVATGAPVQTLRPHPVTTADTGVFDTSQGTVHLVLGCGGTNANLDDYGVDTAGAPTPDYTEFETFTLIRPRSDRHGSHTAERSSALA
jgi:hypothetical protein